MKIIQKRFVSRSPRPSLRADDDVFQPVARGRGNDLFEKERELRFEVFLTVKVGTENTRQ